MKKQCNKSGQTEGKTSIEERFEHIPRRWKENKSLLKDKINGGSRDLEFIEGRKAEKKRLLILMQNPRETTNSRSEVRMKTRR